MSFKWKREHAAPYGACAICYGTILQTWRAYGAQPLPRSALNTYGAPRRYDNPQMSPRADMRLSSALPSIFEPAGKCVISNGRASATGIERFIIMQARAAANIQSIGNDSSIVGAAAGYGGVETRRVDDTNKGGAAGVRDLVTSADAIDDDVFREAGLIGIRITAEGNIVIDPIGHMDRRILRYVATAGSRHLTSDPNFDVAVRSTAVTRYG